MKSNLISLLILSIILSIIYISINIYHLEDISFESLKLNNINFIKKETTNIGDIKKVIYTSSEATLEIYKKRGIVPPRGKPFSSKMNDLFKSIKSPNKKKSVLSDYYHHIFVIKSDKNIKDLDIFFNDYATIIYCSVNKNEEFHPEYKPFRKNNFCHDID